jgi:hypothetical protein
MRGRGAARSTVVLAGLLLVSARTYAEDRQIRPFVGATFGGGTTFFDPEKPDNPAGGANPAIGVSAVFLGEVFGAEVDVADAPGFFDGDKHLVLGSRVTTISGNVVLAAPRRLTEYSLRPYLVGGAGLMRVRRSTASGVFDISRRPPPARRRGRRGRVPDQPGRRLLGRPAFSERRRRDERRRSVVRAVRRGATFFLAGNHGCGDSVLICG